MAEDNNSRIDKIKTLAFIEDYHKYRVLWDHKHKYYSNKSKRNDVLVTLSQKYNYDIRTAKNKIKSLRSYFAKEHQKVVTKRSEPGTEDFESSWFAYKSLSFILDSRETIDSEVTAENHSNATLQDESNESQAPRSENDHEFTQRLRKKRKAYKSRAEREEEAYNTMKTESEKISYNENTEFQTPSSENDREFIQPLKGTRKKRNVHKSRVDERDEEADNITKTASENSRNKDECDAIGRLIACKLRKLTPRNRLLAERRINDVLFNLELEEMDSTHKIYSVPSMDPLTGLSPATSTQSNSTEEENTSNANPLQSTDSQKMLNNQPFLELKVETQDEHESALIWT